MNRAAFYLFVMVCFIFFQSIPFAVSEEYQQNQLEAKITVPAAYSLVRGDVPVYGIACGRDFEEYRLDYGAGENPREWKNIVISKIPQENFQDFSKIDFSLDKTIPGNLGGWDTGLDEYQYGQHQSGLSMGLYTLRLIVRDKKGNVKENRVPVEVGRVVLNAFSSELHSDDGNAILTIEEHSLWEPAKIFSFKAISSEKINIPEGFKRASSVYEINPPGEQFLQPERLTIKYDRNHAVNTENFGIFVFDTDLKEWRLLEAYRNETGCSLETDISVLPGKFALYAVLESSRTSNVVRNKVTMVEGNFAGSLLSRDSFENDFSFWTNKYGTAGALLERDSRKSKDGNYCLKVTNPREGGNFAIARRAQFDASVYSLIRFDYKIPKGVKINMQVKVNKKWCDIMLTDDEKVYWDINMEKIGAVEGIAADNRWHTAEINLYKMLNGRTDTFIVDEIVFVDWDSTGFKKLEMGHNKKGTAYWLDNFTIESDRYFWELRRNNSGKKINPSKTQNTEILINGDELDNFLPDYFNGNLRIKFLLSKIAAQNIYQLRIKPAEEMAQKYLKLYLNNKLIPEDAYVFSDSCLDVFLGKLNTDANMLTLVSSGSGALSLESIGFYPLQNAPWEIKVSKWRNSTEVSQSYSIGIDKVRDCSFVISKTKPELILVSGITARKQSWALRLVLKKNLFNTNTSWVMLNKFEILLNERKIKECYSDGSEELIVVNIPARFIKYGTNFLKFRWLSGAGEIEFKRLSLEYETHE